MISENKIKNGVFYLSIERAINGTLSIILIPIIIKTIGIENFGLWGILLGILNYMQFLDFGVSFSLERFVAFYAAQRSQENIQKLVSTSLVSLFFFCVLLFLIVLVFGDHLIRLLTKNAAFPCAQNLLLFLFPAFAINILQAVYMSIPRGFQRFDIISTIQIIGKVIFIVSLIGLLLYYNDLRALIFAFTLQNFSTFVLSIICAKKIAPTIAILKPGFSLPVLKSLLTFGLKIQISGISFLVVQNFDKMLLSSFFGLVYAGYYEAATRIIYAIRDIPLFLMSVLTPRISELISLKQTSAIKELYQKITKQLTIISFFIMILLLINDRLILSLLLKHSPTEFTLYVFRIICITSFWQVISGCVTFISRGMGLTSVEMKTAFLTLAINIPVSLILMHFAGERGIVAGAAAAMTISPFYSYYLLNKLFSIKTIPFIKSTFLLPFIYQLIMLTIFIFSSPFIANVRISFPGTIVLSSIFIIGTHLFYLLTKDSTYASIIHMIPFSKLFKRS